MANIVIAYIFWLLGGPFGLHHFYLGRDRHALVWFISFGGLALGWFRDLWRLPEYVYESNQDVRYLNEFRTRRRFRPKPPFSVVRFAGQLLIGKFIYRCKLIKTSSDSGDLYAYSIGCPASVWDQIQVFCMMVQHSNHCAQE